MSFRFGPDYRSRLLALPALVQQGHGAPDGAAGKRRGGRLEFREHRPYSPGDDPRDLDWNLYLRLGQLVTKEYEREEAPEVLIILDRSASMGAGHSGKDRVAREIGGGLAYVALTGGCPVTVAVPAEGGPVTLGAWRSHRKLDHVISLLEGLGDPSGPTYLSALRHLRPAPATGRVGLLVSDFLVEPLPAQVAVALARGAGTGSFLHVVAEEERHLAIPQTCTLKDPETGASLFVSRAEALSSAYARELAAHEDAVAALARRHGLGAVVLSDAVPFEQGVIHSLRTQGPA